MKCFFTITVFLISISSSYSQIEDILKKIPGVGDLFEEAVTTNIKDAYPTAYWLTDVDQLKVNTERKFSPDLTAGYYNFRFNTFCLQAGTYAPTEGAGYLLAPLKGSKAGLIKNILTRFGEHPKVEQRNAQLLIWGIEVGFKFSDYPPEFQAKVMPLLSPEDIAKMEINLKEIAYDFLPPDVQNVLELYTQLRGLLGDVNATYEDIERIAVKTGIPPPGKGSKNIPAGTWTSIGDRAYVRSFPQSYQKTDVEIYIPSEVKIIKDSGGRIVSYDDGSYRIDFGYEPAASNFKSAVIKNILTNEESTVENTLTDADYTAFKDKTEELIGLIKKSFGKKKSKRLDTESAKTVEQLKNIELSLGSLIEKTGWLKDAFGVSINALNNFVTGLETGKNKGGSDSPSRKLSGLSNLNNMVMAPANTSQQRLGNGGPEGGNNGDNSENQNQEQEHEKKNKHCDVNIVMHDVDENQLPEPDGIYIVPVDINIEGDDPECLAEEIEFTLYDVSKERGRCMNDIEKYDDVDEDLQVSDMNQGYDMTKTTAKKQLSGQTQSMEFYVWCRDYGAFGKLTVRVKVKGQWHQAYAGSASFVTIPLDKNNNKIADSWEKKNGVFGKSASWDEDPNPSGQARNGDGMTNYEEYRGFFVDNGAGATEYQRMDPMQKEIFVIDEGNIFDIASWKSASGIKAYWLNLNQVFGAKIGNENSSTYRWVNFCAGFAAGVKFAVNLKKIDGIPDPYTLCGSGTDYTGCNVGSPVKNSKMVVVLPDRIKKWLTDTKDTLSVWLAKSPSAKTLKIGGRTFTTISIKKFTDAVSNSKKFEEVMNFYINMTVIHEVGHALGVPHHGGADPKKTSTGDYKCPMRYLEYMDPVLINSARLEEILNLIGKGENIGVSYTWMKFCKTKDNCFKKLDANDR